MKLLTIKFKPWFIQEIIAELQLPEIKQVHKYCEKLIKQREKVIKGSKPARK